MIVLIKLIRYSYISRVLIEGRIDMEYQDINAQTIDRWIREGWEWRQG